jgi:SAM-dependent methyltransferase
MQAYSAAFARVYNQLWASFARQVAPAVLAHYDTTPAGQARLAVLDLATGTGQLAAACLEQGLAVTGLDLSPAMLAIAAENNREAVAAGRARFVEGDVAGFSLPGPFGLVTATYDALNHLPNLAALAGCFACVAQVLHPSGVFIFDLNTRDGLRRWENMTVQEHPEGVILNCGVYDEDAGRAYMRVSGFWRAGAEAPYERFAETVYNTIFDQAEVGQALSRAGFAAHPASLGDLLTPLPEPEAASRVFWVARLAR